MLEVLFPDAYYDSEREEEDYSPELRALLSEFDEGARVYRANTGHGADFPSFIVQLFQDIDWKTLAAGSAGGLFLLGEKIEKNLDAWLRLASRFRKLVAKVKPMRIDEYGATLCVLDKLRGAQKVEGSFRVTVQIIVAQPGPCGHFRLDRRPDAVYIVTVETGTRIHIVGVKSTAEYVFEYDVGNSWYDF